MAFERRPDKRDAPNRDGNGISKPWPRLRDDCDTPRVAAEIRDDARFEERYATSSSTAIMAAELDALGTDYQANGYTTRVQADDLAQVLKLGPGRLLLDIGSGCGWPGLYLSREHGCAVVSIDPVAEGVDVARVRADTDGLAERSFMLRGTAVQLPLRSGSVDAVVHTDVLC